MNDRYLFRAKRIDNGEWVFGSYIYTFCEDKNRIVVGVKVEKHWIVEESGNMVWVYEDTICQCTGLKDKNGKLIWENDIVGFLDTYSTENGHAEMDCIGKVVWDDETISFQVTNRLSAESYEVLDECCVIGNIFDNPELMYE